MTYVGMNVEVIRQIARDLKVQASDIGSVVGRVDNLVARAQTGWKGRDAQAFVGWWQQQHRPRLLSLRAELEGLATSARNNADEQERVSGGVTASASSPGTKQSSGGGARTDGKGIPIQYSSDLPASEKQIKNIDLRLSVLEQQKASEHMPKSYAIAKEWAARLKAQDNPNQAEVESFNRFCYLMHTQSINRGNVEDAAQLGIDSLKDADKSKFSAIVGVVSMKVSGLGGEVSPKLMATDPKLAAELAADSIAKDYVTDVSANGMVDMYGLVKGGDAGSFVRLYDAQSDAYISSLAEAAQGKTEFVRGLPAEKFMGFSVQNVTDEVAALRTADTAASSTSIMTGPESGINKLLWTGLKVVPVVGPALSGAEVAGNAAHASMVEENGGKALRFASGGATDSLRTMAKSMHLDETN